MPQLVSVVLPTVLRVATIEDALAGLAGQRFEGPWEVVLSVNRPGAADEAEALVARWTSRLPDLRFVDSSDVAGVSRARNAGIRASRGQLVAICDDDDVPGPGWLAAMAAASTSADIVGGALDVATLNPPEVRAWHRPLPVDRAPLSLGFWPYAMGCNMAFWRDVYDAVGGFDETWVAGCEEIEWAWRAQRAGFLVGFAPDAVVAYRYRVRVRHLAIQTYRYGRAEPRLFREFRGDGVRRGSQVHALRLWLGLLRRMPCLLRGPAARGAWVRLAAYRAGRLAGSLRARTLYL